MKEFKNAIAKAISLVSSETNVAQETGVKLYGLTQATRKVGAPTHLSPIRELDVSCRSAACKRSIIFEKKYIIY